MASIATAPIMVPEAEVSRALRRLKRLVPSRLNTMYRKVRIGVDVDRDLFIEAHNGEGRGRIYLTAKVKTIGFDVTVSLPQLDEAIKSMGYARLTHDRRGKALAIAGDRATRKLDLYEWEWGEPPEEPYSPFVHAEAAALADVINRVHWFVSKDDTRPPLTKIAFQEHDGDLMAYATDMYRLMRIAVPGAQAPLETTQLLNGHDLTVAVAGAREGGIVLERHPSLVRLRRTGEAWWLRAAHEIQPPPYDAVIRQSDEGETDWDADVEAGPMAEAFDAVAEELPRTIGAEAAVELRFLKTEVVVKSRKEGSDEEYRIKVRSGRRNSVKTGATAWLAKEAFSAFDGVVRVRVYASERRPILISADGKLALLMRVSSGVKS